MVRRTTKAGSRPAPGRLRLGAATALAALTLAGCNTAANVDPIQTSAIPQPVSNADFERAVDAWAVRYDQDETDKTTALGYARALQQDGSTEQAVAFYHSNTQQYQSKYLKLFRPIYQKRLLLARR